MIYKKKQTLPPHEMVRDVQSIAIFLGLSILLVIILKASYSLYVRKSHMEATTLIREKELVALENRKARLEVSLDHIHTPKGKEIELRKHFDIGKVGEELIVVVEKDVQQEIPVAKKTWIEKIRSYILW